MIHWPIVWTHDRAEAKQRRASGVREGIIMDVLYMINLGSTLRFVWAFLAPTLHWSVIVLLTWEFDLVWFKLLLEDLGIRKCLKCGINPSIHPKEIIHRVKRSRLSSAHTSDGSTQHPASLMNKWCPCSLPNCATMSETVFLPFKFLSPFSCKWEIYCHKACNAGSNTLS